MLERSDPEVYRILEREAERQNRGLEMIASENYTFKSVREAMASFFTNKYAEGYPGKRYYGGCENADAVEELACERAKKLFGAKYVNVQPHSGSQANMAVYFALLNPGDRILGMDLSHGGHLSHGFKVNFSGRLYNAFSYGVDLKTGMIDYDSVRDIAKKVNPHLIIAGASAYPRDFEFSKFREIADEVGAYLMADIAHTAGLIVGGEQANPLPFCDVVTATTHKTLRGPRGGVILTNRDDLAKKIDSAVFPGIQGGPLMHIIAAKAVGFGENLKPEWKKYAHQVVMNTRVLADNFLKNGYDLVSGGSDNHLILVSFLYRNLSGKDAEHALGRAGITVNKNTVPGEFRSPFVASGIRIGSPALTSRGMREYEFEVISKKIIEVLDEPWNFDKQEKIRKELEELALKFPVL